MTSYFSPPFPPRLAFWKGEGWGKVKTWLCNKCEFHVAAFYPLPPLLGVRSPSLCVQPGVQHGKLAEKGGVKWGGGR